jgi:hypothetical protein
MLAGNQLRKVAQLKSAPGGMAGFSRRRPTLALAD